MTIKKWLAGLIWLVVVAAPLVFMFSIKGFNVQTDPILLGSAAAIVGAIWVIPTVKQWWDERP